MTSESAQPPGQEPRWHVKVGKTTQGPLTDAEMLRLFGAGKLGPKTLVWGVGLPNWLPCSAITELSELICQADGIPGNSHWGSSLSPGRIARIRAGLKRSQDRVFDFIRRRVRVGHVITAAVAIAVAAAFFIYRAYFYKPPHDGLLSLYASKIEDGTSEEIARVEKRGPSYFLSQKRDGRWAGAEPVRPMVEKEFVELFGNSWGEADPLGLVNANGQTALLRVKSGWTNGDFTCESGFFLMRPEGPTQIAQIEAKSLALPSLARTPQESAATPASSIVPQAEAADAGQLASVGGDATGSETGSVSRDPAEAATLTDDAPPNPEETPKPLDDSPLTEPPSAQGGSTDAPPIQDAKPQDSTASYSQQNEPDKLKADLRSLRKQAYAARGQAKVPRLAGFELRDSDAFAKGEAALSASKQHESEGRLAEAINATREAIADFAVAQKARDKQVKAAQDSAEAQMSAAGIGPPAPNAPEPTKPAEVKVALRFEAVKLERNVYKHGETLQARINVLGLDRRRDVRRFDTLLAKQNGRYVELMSPKEQGLPVDPPNGFHATTLTLDSRLPPGSYRLHSAISCPSDPSGANLEHDFDFDLLGSPSGAKVAGQGDKNALGQLLDGLDKLAGGGKKKKGHSSRH